jgi:hypothetical protein
MARDVLLTLATPFDIGVDSGNTVKDHAPAGHVRCTLEQAVSFSRLLGFPGYAHKLKSVRDPALFYPEMLSRKEGSLSRPRACVNTSTRTTETVAAVPRMDITRVVTPTA